MTNITESSSFSSNVSRYDTTDPVLGGLAGESNSPIIALTNRTRYLYNSVNGFDGVQSVTSSATITNTSLRKMILVNVSANTTITIGAGSGFIEGQRLSFMVKTTGIKSVGFVLSGGDVFLNLYSIFTGLWLHNGEQINLVWTGAGWWIEDVNTGLLNVGRDGMARQLPPNTMQAIGTNSLIRADYARLWDAVGGSAITEATWATSAPNNQSFFTTGNTTTTFRAPDMRSMSWRALDLGRNISLTRTGSNPGAYEADAVKSHNHTFQTGGDNLLDNNVLGKPLGRQNDDAANTTVPTSFVGGPENLIKNIGLIPFIHY